MLFELFFIFLFTLLLVTLLVPVGGYSTHHDRLTGRPASVGDEPEDVDAGIGIWMTMLFFFFILFPLIIAGNAWVGPRGPVFMGVSWGPIVAIGIILALLLATVLPRRPKPKKEPSQEELTQKTALGLFSIVFFFLLIVLFTVIIAGYSW